MRQVFTAAVAVVVIFFFFFLDFFSLCDLMAFAGSAVGPDVVPKCMIYETAFVRLEVVLCVLWVNKIQELNTSSRRSNRPDEIIIARLCTGH